MGSACLKGVAREIVTIEALDTYSTAGRRQTHRPFLAPQEPDLTSISERRCVAEERRSM